MIVEKKCREVSISRRERKAMCLVQSRDCLVRGGGKVGGIMEKVGADAGRGEEGYGGCGCRHVDRRAASGWGERGGAGRSGASGAGAGAGRRQASAVQAHKFQVVPRRWVLCGVRAAATLCLDFSVVKGAFDPTSFPLGEKLNNKRR